MKTKARIGAIIHLQIKRANGSVEDLGKIHNVLGYAMLSANVRHEYGSTQAVTHLLHDVAVGYPLNGTFSRSGTTVTRVTGTGDLSTGGTNDLLEFGSGEKLFKNGVGSATTCETFSSGVIAATTLKIYRIATYDNAGSSPILTKAGSTTRSYATGVLEWLDSTPVVFDPAATPFSLVRIRSYLQIGGTQYTHFDLPAPVAILAGDQVIVSSFRLTYTFDDYEPRVFAVSPLTGVTDTGTIQRMRRVTSREGTAPNRIWLLSDANKVTPIPDMLGPSATVLNPATLTTIETITGTGSVTAPAGSNQARDSASIFGTVITGGTVKQILWGTTTEVHGLIEYDTPQVIAAGKIITIASSLRVIPETP